MHPVQHLVSGFSSLFPIAGNGFRQRDLAEAGKVFPASGSLHASRGCLGSNINSGKCFHRAEKQGGAFNAFEICLMHIIMVFGIVGQSES
jgi:hypothetical protein